MDQQHEHRELTELVKDDGDPARDERDEPAETIWEKETVKRHAQAILDEINKPEPSREIIISAWRGSNQSAEVVAEQSVAQVRRFGFYE
jgi:hypothetical protein